MTTLLRKSHIGVLGALLLASSCSAAAPEVESSDRQPPTMSRDVASQLPAAAMTEEHQVPIVVLRGDAVDRGRAIGEGFRDELQTKVQAYVRGPLSAMIGGRKRALGYVREIEPGIPQEAREEMQALASAAGVEYEDIVLFNVFSDLLTSGCTTVAVDGQRSEGGLLRMARNTDLPMPEAVRPRPIVAVVHPEEGIPHAGYTWPGMIGAPTALNGAGVVLAINGSSTHATTRRCVPIAFATRAALSQSRTAEELVARLESTSHCGGFVVVVADETDSIALELSPGRTGRLRPTDGVLTATNHYQVEAMIDLQVGAREESRGRLDVVRRAVVPPVDEPITRDRLGQALSRDGVFQPFTVLSILIEPAERTLWLWDTSQPRGRYVSVDVSDALVQQSGYGGKLR